MFSKYATLSQSYYIARRMFHGLTPEDKLREMQRLDYLIDEFLL